MGEWRYNYTYEPQHWQKVVSITYQHYTTKLPGYAVFLEFCADN
jgi:hypothetical protein